MTEFTSLLDWESSVHKLRAAHLSVAPADAQTWEHKITNAIKGLPYFERVKTAPLDDYSLFQRIQMRSAAGDAMTVRQDLRTVLNRYVFGNERDEFVFVRRDGGFDIYIAIIDSDSLLFTSKLQVQIL
ncbi:MAG: hypothetical protein JNK63_06050 [Chthonomonas sp.]|nr:hypothetical protein [Chthonomonas sp.]